MEKRPASGFLVEGLKVLLSKYSLVSFAVSCTIDCKPGIADTFYSASDSTRQLIQEGRGKREQLNHILEVTISLTGLHVCCQKGLRNASMA